MSSSAGVASNRASPLHMRAHSESWTGTTKISTFRSPGEESKPWPSHESSPRTSLMRIPISNWMTISHHLLLRQGAGLVHERGNPKPPTEQRVNRDELATPAKLNQRHLPHNPMTQAKAPLLKQGPVTQSTVIRRTNIWGGCAGQSRQHRTTTRHLWPLNHPHQSNPTTTNPNPTRPDDIQPEPEPDPTSLNPTDPIHFQSDLTTK